MSASVLWLTNTPLHLPLRPQNCKMTYLDATYGWVSLVCAQLSWRQYPAKTPAGSSFQRSWHSVTSLRRMAGSPGRLKKQKRNVAWILTKPAAVDCLWPPCWDTLIRPSNWQYPLSYKRTSYSSFSFLLYGYNEKTVQRSHNCSITCTWSVHGWKRKNAYSDSMFF